MYYKSNKNKLNVKKKYYDKKLHEENKKKYYEKKNKEYSERIVLEIAIFCFDNGSFKTAKFTYKDIQKTLDTVNDMIDREYIVNVFSEKFNFLDLKSLIPKLEKALIYKQKRIDSTTKQLNSDDGVSVSSLNEYLIDALAHDVNSKGWN